MNNFPVLRFSYRIITSWQTASETIKKNKIEIYNSQCYRLQIQSLLDIQGGPKN